MSSEAPIRHLYDLGDLSQAGSEIAVTARGDELAKLARWAGVDAMQTFAAGVTLRRLSQTRFSYEADLDADILQSCVVTLEPLTTHISRHIARDLHFAPRAQSESGELTLAAGDDDVPEMISSLEYDVAAPLLEELALVIDPYPRKEGATFVSPADAGERPENPFAVLKDLKNRG